MRNGHQVGVKVKLSILVGFVNAPFIILFFLFINDLLLGIFFSGVIKKRLLTVDALILNKFYLCTYLYAEVLKHLSSYKNKILKYSIRR